MNDQARAFGTVIKPPPARRETQNMKRQRSLFRQKSEASDAHCWLCGMPIDYDASSFADESFSLDHYFPVSKYPELQEDPANFRPSHTRCNKSRGNGPPMPPLGELSRAW